MERLAVIEIDAVTPSSRGFTLTGQGMDRAQYRLDLHFDHPLDGRTRTVIGELLAQSDLTISRGPSAPAATVKGSAPARSQRARNS
jgi:hypothetical protein